MDGAFWQELGRRGVRMPIGADLVLREEAAPEEVLRDGGKLARVLVRAAERYGAPLVFPVMDLALEKEAMLGMMGIEEGGYQFGEVPGEAMMARFEERLKGELPVRMRANGEALRLVKGSGRVAVGMSIGPVSLMTKLIADPITPIYLAGTGVAGEEDEEVRRVEVVLELATRMVLRSIEAQVEAGADAIFVAEPAANKAYFSPNQWETGVWERYVMAANRRVAAMLKERGVALLFHCCGELTDEMVGSFGMLGAAMLSLGSSRELWRDAALVPAECVLYGNLPTKLFYSEALMPEEKVAALTRELAGRMREVGHGFVLGSECDVLSVPGAHDAIVGKVGVMMRA